MSHETYDRLMLAVGAKPFVPNIAGIDSSDVYTITKLNEVKRLQQELSNYQNIVILGGGFIGIEVADQLTKAGKNIHLIEMAPHLMNRSFDPEFSTKIKEAIEEENVRVSLEESVLEIDQEVMDCLPYRPFLLKPNEEELSSWFGRKMVTDEDYFVYGQRLVELGAENVLLSLGEKGAILFTKDRVFRGNSPKGKVVNTACAGDTMLGAFLAGYMNRRPLDETLRKSIAAGSSTAFRKGLTDFLDVEELSKQIKIREERFERWENIN